ILIVLFAPAVYTAHYHKRIVGGKETTIEKFPYQAMVLCENFLFVALCGGAVLNKKTIITAAHCVADCSENDLVVIAGSSEYDTTHQHEVDSKTIHTDYQDDEIDNDIAIICLKSALQYSNRIQPIAVTDQIYPEGTNAVVTGWGRTNDNKVSSKLRYANVKLISNRHCRVMNPLVDDTQLCTNGGSYGPCKGDSGGPLAAHNKLVGIVSYGNINCSSKMVRMYANVYHFRNFIQDNMC
ncbi:Trypsin, partial [Oryctes borbonicus]